MITVLKVNVITDDDGLPEVLKEKIEKLLQAEMRDDPEGASNAIVQLEWKQTIMPRSYMRTLVGRAAERIRLPEPTTPVKAKTRKAATR